MITVTATPAAGTQPSDVPDLRQLRATVLRSVLALTEAHAPSMPCDIGMSDHTSRGGYRFLVLHMDRNAAHDFHRWAAVLGLTAREPSDFDLDTARRWRALRAGRHDPDGPFTGWGLVEVSCYIDLPPYAQDRDGDA
ncbi:hypothetical protein [Actinoplanes sp. NPDC049681]|uniref:hypothetical protein n=1 Tax=Actinoplanes sp. NPDC049681 TaxID=3363905 RepID=UPI00378B96EB